MRLLFALSTFVVAAMATNIEIRATPVAFSGKPMQTPAEIPRTGASTSHGCYSSAGDLTVPDGQTNSSVTRGYCENSVCKGMSATVMATKGEQCFCGFAYPPKADLVDDSKCDFPCPGYPQEACGSVGSNRYWSVYNTGISVDVPDSDPVSSSASSSASGPTASASSPAISQPPQKDHTGPNVAGIAAGVVVGVVVVAAAIGGGLWYMRRRRNQVLEEEHRRNAAVNAFVGGGKAPGSSGGLSMTDSRMDPGMSHRRLSDGSIADNQDYSRKILRVTNA